ncbi:MAG: LptF/LptG family permease [Bdellovibrionota bacterium]
MGILGRYVIKEILKIQMPIWFAFGFLIFLLEWMGRAFTSDSDAWTQFLIYLCKVPSYLQLVFPMSVLFAFLIVFGQLAKNREMVAVQSMGYSNKRILIPAFVALAIACVPYYFVMNVVSPAGMKKHFEIIDTQIKGRESRFLQVRQEKIWYRNQDVLYTIHYFDPLKAELFGVTIYTFDEDFHIAQTVYADHAVWNRGEWLLKKGRIYVTDKRLRMPIIEEFEERRSRLIENPSQLRRVDWSPETLGQGDLSRAIVQSKALGINTAEWETTYHSRWSFFAVAFVFILLAFPRATRFHRASGVARDGVFVAGVCVVYWLLFNFGVNLGNSGRIPPMAAAWLPTLLFVVGVHFYTRSLTLRNTSD